MSASERIVRRRAEQAMRLEVAEVFQDEGLRPGSLEWRRARRDAVETVLRRHARVAANIRRRAAAGGTQNG